MPFVSPELAAELNRNANGRLKNWQCNDGKRPIPKTGRVRGLPLKDEGTYSTVWTPAMIYPHDPLLRHQVIESMPILQSPSQAERFALNGVKYVYSPDEHADPKMPKVLGPGGYSREYVKVQRDSKTLAATKELVNNIEAYETSTFPRKKKIASMAILEAANSPIVRKDYPINEALFNPHAKLGPPRLSMLNDKDKPRSNVKVRPQQPINRPGHELERPYVALRRTHPLSVPPKNRSLRSQKLDADFLKQYADADEAGNGDKSLSKVLMEKLSREVVIDPHVRMLEKEILQQEPHEIIGSRGLYLAHMENKRRTEKINNDPPYKKKNYNNPPYNEPWKERTKSCWKNHPIYKTWSMFKKAIVDDFFFTRVCCRFMHKVDTEDRSEELL